MFTLTFVLQDERQVPDRKGSYRDGLNEGDRLCRGTPIGIGRGKGGG